MKSYIPHKGLDAVILKSKWLSEASGPTEGFKEWEGLEEREVTLTKAKQDRIPGLLCPWELKGKELIEYWNGVKERWNKWRSAQNPDEIENTMADRKSVV